MITSEVAVSLAEQLDINAVTAVSHQHQRIRGDDKHATQVLYDMRLTDQ